MAFPFLSIFSDFLSTNICVGHDVSLTASPYLNATNLHDEYSACLAQRSLLLTFGWRVIWLLSVCPAALGSFNVSRGDIGSSMEVMKGLGEEPGIGMFDGAEFVLGYAGLTCSSNSNGWT